MRLKIKALEAHISQINAQLSEKNSNLQYYEQHLRVIPELQEKILQASKYVTDQKSIIESLQAGIAQRNTWLAEKDFLLQSHAEKLKSVSAAEAYCRAMQNAADVMTTVETMEVNKDNRYVEFEDLSVESVR
jgi:chromosome segregation ATPase